MIQCNVKSAKEAYILLCDVLVPLYDAPEASIISRYLVEDLLGANFWSESPLTDEQVALVCGAIPRLLAYEPWQYVGGQADFFGLKFVVSPAVLIPRPETEELVHIAMQIIKRQNLKIVLDIGTGSGIIPITLARKTALNLVFGLDISCEALAVALLNADTNVVNVTWIASDILDESLWDSLPKVQMVLSNPPYILPAEQSMMSSNVLNFEPHLALFVEDDPLLFYKKIGTFVQNHQDKGTHLLFEINEKYGFEVVELMESLGYSQIQLIQDMQGKDRIVKAVS